MAVTFISYGYDTLPGEGLSETVWQDMFPVIGLASYGVRSPADWKVTAVAGQDRTVSIAAGRGFGLGVIDKTFENETMQLGTITSGSRWDLIAVRRDPTPSAGLSKFIIVPGGSTPVIPGGRLSGPGIHDQPIALVQVTSGQTQPTGFIDLRVWAGDGGGLVANHDLVRSYLNQTGTRLWINGVDWVRRAGANDTPEWVRSFPTDGTVNAVGGGALLRSDNTANINAGDTTLRVNIDQNLGASWSNRRGSGLECNVPGVYFISGRLLTDGPAGRYGTLYTTPDKTDMVGSLTWTEDSPGAAYGGISFSGTFICPTGPAFWFTTTGYNTGCTIRPASRVTCTRISAITTG